MGNSLAQKIMRRKKYEDDVMNTKLDRCLDTIDIAMFGISHMVGAGIFILTGTLISQIAGPAAVLSFVLAGFSSFLTALCYAELATRLPKAGSCYTYTYFAFGELPAFLVGWMMLLDFTIGMAAIAKGFGATVNAVTSNAVRNWTIGVIGGPIEMLPFSEYPDLVALALVAAATITTATGAKIGLRINVVIAILLITQLSTMIVASYMFADTKNWSEHGGFMPYGVRGVLSGASIAVYAFSGFDKMANTSEEARDPRKSIPTATLVALTIVTILYINSTLGLSLMRPYDQIDASAPFAYAFMHIGKFWLFVLASSATLMATSGSKLVEMYVIPRILYALASDGLLFPIFGKIWQRTKVPLFSLLVAAFVCSILAVFIEITVLADVASVGMLISYTMAGIDILLIRYNNYEMSAPDTQQDTESEFSSVDKNSDVQLNASQAYPRLKKSGCISKSLVVAVCKGETASFDAALWIYVCCSLATAALFVFGLSTSMTILWWLCAALFVPLLTIIAWVASIVIFSYEPASNDKFFQMPLMPTIPLMAISYNCVLLMTIKPDAWIRFAVCIAIGLMIYFGYGIRHSHCTYDCEVRRLISEDSKKTFESTADTNASTDELPNKS